MIRPTERAERTRRKAKAEQRALEERTALEAFVPTPRPTRLATAVQRVLGPPPVDDPVYGRRHLALDRMQEALDHDTPPDPNGAQPHSDGER